MESYTINRELPWHAATQQPDGSFKIHASFSSREAAENHPEGTHIIQTKEPRTRLYKALAGGAGGIAGVVLLSPITPWLGFLLGVAIAGDYGVFPGYALGAIAGPVIGGAISLAIFAKDKEVRNIFTKQRIDFGNRSSDPFPSPLPSDRH